MNAPYGCHSQPRAEGYMVKDGIVIKGSIALQMVRYHKDASTRECQYRISTPTDPRCQGCTCP